ncbi:ATP-grasp domain-containing protein [Prevotella aff. ruminicola Tc2-24]|uniref:ATP-grasp domain-containing protein n=1 Tax=Prevotella aff. ruminicola Tc2-24 TaxID=81582 RepID=A0A1I0M832_9BACT|nr:ATP-grasp domain-containing protein [Prevotella aff. ruminicola Tc2-24]SEV84268.1 ATP-grasp domain-containing protein [Prevotella aff. ruminicola Tc2-24]
MKEFEGKKLLVLGGFTLACDIVRAAQNLGACVIVADYNPESPAKDVADKFALISILDIDALEKFCREEGVDGVTTGFVDILLKPCYELCHRLGLPCYMTPKMIEVSTNKVEFKTECNKYGVPVPQTYLVGGEITEEIYQKISYPVFVKPLDSSGSRGAGVCYNREELDARFEEALSYSVSHNAIIEDYITGREFLLDYIAVDGEFRLLSMFDRYMTPDRGSAVNYSNISMTPSKAIDKYLAEINDKVIAMFKGLGFKDGVLFMQGYFDGNKITFFEMGCRLGGSYYNHQRACLGHNAIDMVVRYALKGIMTEEIQSIPTDIAKYKGKYALDCDYLLKGSDETIAQIVGLEEIRKMSCVVEIQQFHDVGYHYVKDRTVDKCVVDVEIVCNSREEVIEKVNYLNKTFDVLNEEGESLLITKLEPEELFKD